MLVLRAMHACRYGGGPGAQAHQAEDNQAMMAELARRFEPEANKFG